jgi:Fanconi anemia group M protein
MRHIGRSNFCPTATCLVTLIPRDDDAIVVGTMHRMVVDHSERTAPLLTRVHESGAFTVEMSRLPTGDYLIDDRILIERKTRVDFIASLIDGRLFPQVARLAHSKYRSLMLIEGPEPSTAPDVHPHSVAGALVSIAAMWRLPVLHSTDVDESYRLLRFLAEQGNQCCQTVLPRYDRKPKRLATRRLFVLQGLPGVGPGLALRLLRRFGSVERVFTAEADALAAVPGIGPKKAAGIRETVSGENDAAVRAFDRSLGGHQPP